MRAHGLEVEDQRRLELGLKIEGECGQGGGLKKGAGTMGVKSSWGERTQHTDEQRKAWVLGCRVTVRCRGRQVQTIPSLVGQTVFPEGFTPEL